MNLGPQDDTAIPDEEVLYRRIAKDWIVPGSAEGRKVLSSQAFHDRKKEVSVDRASLTSPAACLAGGGPNICGIVSVTAKQVRELNLDVTPDPMPGNPAHALIHVQTKRQSKQLSTRARWEYPEGANPFL
jgi:hypothetical protein